MSTEDYTHFIQLKNEQKTPTIVCGIKSSKVAGRRIMVWFGSQAMQKSLIVFTTSQVNDNDKSNNTNKLIIIYALFS